MSSSPLIRQAPAGVMALLVILAGSIIAQVIPVSRTPEQPAPDLPHAVAAVPGSPQALAVASTLVSSADPGHEDEDDPMEELIAQALDQETDLDIEDTPIRDAFDLLAAQTGIRIEVEPGTVGLLPYGSSTTVSATIKGRPLRDSLTALLRPIGLKFDVENGRVVIRATPPLRRCVDRTTWKELALLEKLDANPWSDELAKSLAFQFQDSTSTSADVNRDTLLRLARNVGQGTAAQVLEQATDRYGWTWYPSGDLVVVLPKTRQIERQLQKPISVDYTQMSLQDALLDLTRKARVPLRIEPGALTSLSPFVAERFSMKARNTPVRELLELMAGQTGLAYYIEQDGVRIASNPLGSAGAATRSADNPGAIVDAIRQSRYTNPVVGQLILPRPDGSQVSLFLREDDLPPDVKDGLKSLLRAAGESFRVNLQAMTRPHD